MSDNKTPLQAIQLFANIIKASVKGKPKKKVKRKPKPKKKTTSTEVHLPIIIKKEKLKKV